MLPVPLSLVALSTFRQVIKSASGRSAAPSSVDKLIDPPYVNLLLAFAGSRDVVRRLHTHERIHLHAEGLLYAERHVPRKIGPTVKQARQAIREAQLRRRLQTSKQASGLNDFRAKSGHGRGAGPCIAMCIPECVAFTSDC